MTLKFRNFLIAFVLALAAAGTCAADGPLSDALRAHSKRLRGMLTDIVAAMPEDKYDYRPVKEVRSFHEMCEHLVGDIYAHSGYVMGKSPQESAKVFHEQVKSLKTRADILAGLNAAYDYSDQMLAQVTDRNAYDTVTAMRGMKATLFEAAMQAFEDQMDHYGNLVVYLRINGVVPPDTANRDKEMKQNMGNTRGGDMGGMGGMNNMDHGQH